MSEENLQISENFQWMTKEYFQEILRKDVGDSSVIVEDFQVSPAGKGENYSSQILRVVVDYSCGPHNLRLRIFPDDPVIKIQKFQIQKLHRKSGFRRQRKAGNDEKKFLYFHERNCRLQ
jgi:hypothetical protein